MLNQDDIPSSNQVDQLVGTALAARHANAAAAERCAPPSA